MSRFVNLPQLVDPNIYKEYMKMNVIKETNYNEEGKKVKNSKVYSLNGTFYFEKMMLKYR